MGITADKLISQFSKNEEAPNRNILIANPDKFHFEKIELTQDVTKLKYLAEAGIPEAIIAYAKLCFDGRYVSENKPKAFKLISKLLNNLPAEDQLAWVRKHLADGFVGEVIRYQFKHQYGTAHGHKWWTWANQVRLNFTRMTIIAKLGVLDVVRKHPAYASLAFGMFFVRIFYDVGVFFHSYHRNLKKIEVLNQSYDGKGFSVWFKRFINKDGRPLRYANDLVWACLGITGFVMDMVGLGGYAAAVPLVLGFLFDVGVELYRAIKLYQAYSEELEFLGLQIQDCVREKEVNEREIQTHLTAQRKLTRELNQCKIPADQDKIRVKLSINDKKITDLRTKISELEARCSVYNSRRIVVEEERSSKAKRSTFVVAATALLFAGMLIGRIIPLAVSIDPMIGLGLVFAASAMILIHKLVESIIDYKDQKLKAKIQSAGKTNNTLMREVYGDQLDEALLVDEETVLKKCEPPVLPSIKFRLFSGRAKQALPSDAENVLLEQAVPAM